MKKAFTVTLFLIGMFVTHAFGLQTTTVYIDCWSGGWCAMPCGGGVTGNYDCSSGHGGWTPSCGFFDPLPTGSILKSVQAVVYNHQCNASSNITTALTGVLIATVTENRYSCQCLNSPCLDTTFSSATYDAGFPGYVYGGNNLFQITVNSGVICVEHVELRLTYSLAKLEILKPIDNDDFDLIQSNHTATEPIDFQAHVEPAGGTDTVQWNVRLEYRTSGGRGPFVNERNFESAPEEIHQEIYTSMGGLANVSATAIIEGESKEAIPVTYTITGIVIPDAEITNRLIELYHGPTERLMTGIAMVESSYRQFAITTLYRRNDLWPLESYDGGSHIGLMQVPVNMQWAWDWMENTYEGVRLFQHEKIPAARRIANRIRAQIRQQYAGHLRPLDRVELERMALVLYGPHASADLWRQYYVPQQTPAGDWEWVVNTAGNPGGVAYADLVWDSMR